MNAEGITDLDETKVEVGVDFGIYAAQRIVGCKMKVQLIIESFPRLTLQVELGFRISADHWDACVDNEANTLNLPLHFLQQITVLTYSTSRGILFAKAENSRLSGIVLPILNVDQLIQDTPKIALSTFGSRA